MKSTESTALRTWRIRTNRLVATGEDVGRETLACKSKVNNAGESGARLGNNAKYCKINSIDSHRRIMIQSCGDLPPKSHGYKP